MNAAQGFYRHLDQEKRGAKDSTFQQVLGQFVPAPGGRLLDIGCFDGSKTVLVREALQTAEAYGVDFIPNRLAEAEQRGIRTLCVDLNNGLPLDFSSGHFDVVYCGEVIEHLFSPDDLVDEIARLLRPGGYAVLTTPNLAAWKNRLVLLLGWQPFYTEVSTRERYGNPMAPRGLPSGHIRLFTARALREMVQAAGLRVEHVAGVAMLSGANTLVGRVSRRLDAFLPSRWPELADRVILRARKPKDT